MTVKFYKVSVKSPSICLSYLFRCSDKTPNKKQLKDWAQLIKVIAAKSDDPSSIPKVKICSCL